MGCRADLHRRLGDVDVGELLELVVHAGKLLDDVLPGIGQLALDPGDVEKDSPMGTASALANLSQDAASHVIAGEQLGRPPGVLVALGIAPAFFLVVRGLAPIVLGDIVEHEALALRVQQNPPLTPYTFGHEDTAHAGRPDHARGMELHELHVLERGAGLIRERLAVAGVLPAVAGDRVGPPDTAGRKHHGLGTKKAEATPLAIIAHARRTPCRRR